MDFYFYAKKMATAFLMLFFLTVLSFSALALGTVTGSVKTVRNEGLSVTADKYASIQFYEADTQTKVGEPITIESGATTTGSVSFLKKIVPGNYDMVIQKKGYLPYAVKKIAVNSNSFITLPELKLIPGDLTGDGIINSSDLVVSLRAFDTSSAFELVRMLADVNEDGVTNVSDIGIVKSIGCFGKTTANDATLPYSATYDSPQNYGTDLMNAAYLIDDAGMLSMGNIQSGWDFDNRGGIVHTSTYAVNDISTSDRVALIRQITEQTSGELTLESLFSVASAENGFSVILGDGEDIPAFRLFTKSGIFYMQGKSGAAISTGIAVTSKSYYIKAKIDIDNQSIKLYVDGSFVGTYDFATACTKINLMMYSSTEADLVNVTPGYTRLYRGYFLNDRFISTPQGGTPATWNLSVQDGMTGKVEANNSSKYDDNGYTLTAPQANSTGTFSSEFDPAVGKVCFETKFLLPQYQNNASFAIFSGTRELFRFVTAGSNICDGNGTVLRAYSANVWQTLRLEANLNTGIAVVKINMKKVAEIAINADFINKVVVGYAPGAVSSLYVDDFYVYNLHDEDADYVPVPSPIASTDYEVGVEVCNIWRNGYHACWDFVAPFEEIHPYLGYYDEGMSEVADWEIKFMTEHGIDFQLTCWYSCGGTTPMKTPRNVFGLNDGYLNAKYSDKMKFAIMWENSGNQPANSADFREYFVKYWVDYYLTDSRYYTIDNKPLITIYNYSKLLEVFGTTDAVKTELDYLRQVCVGLGYNGAIILCTSGTSDTTALNTIKSMGFDGTYAYNWGRASYDPTVQINSINAQNNKGIMDTIPTIGVGFNDVPINDVVRNPNISLPDYESLFDWTKNTFLSARDSASWKSKLVLLSNWNEYGEGHYIMPSSLNGFGYLDKVRKAFTTNEVHTDLEPTAQQKSRINNLFPQDRKKIRLLRWETVGIDPTNLQFVYGWNFANQSDASLWKAYFNINNFKNTGGVLSGNGTVTDYALLLNNNIAMNPENADYIHLRMKNVPNPSISSASAEIYFITATDSVWNNDKRFVISITPDGEWHDYYIRIDGTSNWTGTITNIRLDPMAAPGSFEISTFEFMNEIYQPKVYIDNTQMYFDFKPEISENRFVGAVNPKNQFFSSLKSYYKWNFNDKILTVKANHHEVVFTMGSNKALADQQEISLYMTPYLRDGLPVIPVDTLLQYLDYILIKKDNNSTASIYTVSNAYYNAITTRVPNEWEFNVPFDFENWTNSNSALTGYADGRLLFKAQSSTTRFDPLFASSVLSVNASDYSKVVVGMRHTLATAQSSTTSIFFQNATMSDFDGTNKVSLPVTSRSSSSTVEYTFNMSGQSGWTGKITRLRFDPFEVDGNFEIDYIRLVP
jgi:hypothetical protein